MSVQVCQLVGGAGTGKTAALLDLMDYAVDYYDDPFLVGYVSFTRAARREGSTRAGKRYGVAPDSLEHQGWFRTLHSVCKRCLRVGGELITDDKKSRDWLQEVLQVNVTGPQSALSGDDWANETDADKAADRAMRLWDAARHRLEPLERVWTEAYAVDSQTPDLDFCRDLAVRYEEQKALHQRVDFTDLILRFGGFWAHPDGIEKRKADGFVPNVPVWLLDEQQDVSPAIHEVCTRLVADASWCYIVGDPFQCQPAGTLVRTVAGEKPIERLDEENDWLVAYSTKDSKFYGRGKQLAFKKASRIVDSSNVVEFTTETGRKLLSTKNHRWFCRIDKPLCFAVYVMQQRQRWRVGAVQLFSNGKTAGESRFSTRCQQERAEAGWILKTFKTDREARMYEQIVSCKYGLPQVTFRPPHGDTNLDSAFLDGVFSGLGDLTQAGWRCLREHQRSPVFAFYRPNSGRRLGLQYGTKIESCNVLPGLMRIPRVEGDRIVWELVTEVCRLPPNEKTVVYSLEVEKHHTYVADGYVTCNSIYGWAGADPSMFMKGWDYKKSKVMPHSWRCPAPILALGEEVLRGCSDYWDRGITPAERPGSVEDMSLKDVGEIVDPREEWLVLTRTNWLANIVRNRLDAAGVPHIDTRGGGKWSAPKRLKAIRAMWNAQRGAAISGDEWQAMLKYIPSNVSGTPMLIRGTKKEWAGYSEKEALNRAPWVVPEHLFEIGASPYLCDVIKSGQWTQWIERSDETLEAIATWGTEAITTPKVRVGTIHSAKGREADNVAVLKTVPVQVERNRWSDRGYDEEQRVAYVAVTRAKERLVLLSERRAKHEMEI